MIKRIALALFLLLGVRIWAQTAYNFAPTASLNTQFNTTTSYKSQALTSTITAQGDLSATFNLLTGLSISPNVSTGLSVTTFARNLHGSTFSPSLSLVTEFDTTAQYTGTQLNANPTTSFSVTTFTRAAAGAGYTFSPTIALTTTISAANGGGWISSAAPTVAMSPTALFKLAGPAAGLSISTTGTFDGNNAVQGILVATGMTVAFSNVHPSFLPSIAIATEMDASVTSASAGTAASSTTSMSSQLAFAPLLPGVSATFNLSAAFYKNSLNQSMNAALNPTIGMQPNLGTIPTPFAAVDTTTAQAIVGTVPAANASTSTSMTAGFLAAYNFNPTLSTTVALNVSQFSNPHTNSVQAGANVFTAVTAQAADGLSVSAIAPSVGVTVGNGFGTTAIANPATTMTCSFSVGRSSTRKIMLIIS